VIYSSSCLVRRVNLLRYVIKQKRLDIIVQRIETPGKLKAEVHLRISLSMHSRNQSVYRKMHMNNQRALVDSCSVYE
jgi:hypothetical protein